MIEVNDQRVDFFSTRLRQKLPNAIRRIILFGSRARGDAHEGSDYDFAVICQTRDAATKQAVREVEVEFLNRFDTLSSSLVFDENGWERRKNLPIRLNIEKEGILL